MCALRPIQGRAGSAPPGDAQTVCPMAEMVILNHGIIRQAHTEGRRVFVWFGVIENPFTVRVMRFFGADGLIVNDPMLVKVE